MVHDGPNWNAEASLPAREPDEIAGESFHSGSALSKTKEKNNSVRGRKANTRERNRSGSGVIAGFREGPSGNRALAGRGSRHAVLKSPRCDTAPVSRDSDELLTADKHDTSPSGASCIIPISGACLLSGLRPLRVSELQGGGNRIASFPGTPPSAHAERGREERVKERTKKRLSSFFFFLDVVRRVKEI